MKISHLAAIGALALGTAAFASQGAKAFSGVAGAAASAERSPVVNADWDRGDWRRGHHHRRHWRPDYPRFSFRYSPSRYVYPAPYPMPYYSYAPRYPRYGYYGYQPGVSLNFRF